MNVIYTVCFVLLFVAALLALVRIERGPSMFDRILAVDIMTAVVLGIITVISAVTRRTDLVPVLVVLSLVGFVGSVSIARFAAIESADEARILTKDELRVILAERDIAEDDDAPAVHDLENEDGVVITVLDLDDEARPGPQGGGRRPREPDRADGAEDPGAER